MITDISGRGLGLAIVREKVEKLGGLVSVESQANIGTTFHLILPLTLSTFRGVLVRTGEYLYAIPTVNVERTVRINKEDIKTVENRETFMLNQDIIATVKLSDALGLNDKAKGSLSQKENTPSNTDFIQIIVLIQSNKRIGFKVDEIIDEHQILVKDLGKQLRRVRNISGATVLGSGTVVPVINVSDLMESAIRGVKTKVTIGEVKASEKLYRILVTEDSITSRALIKDILETAGYAVETAVDGVDGYTKALIGEFDLIVSDVDMPRMNGFELTTKIRNDKKLCELPVVLVTALETREDREHGIDVGANAYIIKSSFDQSNLLDVIQKLL
jgi:two-component system chemotaxis sensor kinase CheA